MGATERMLLSLSLPLRLSSLFADCVPLPCGLLTHACRSIPPVVRIADISIALWCGLAGRPGIASPLFWQVTRGLPVHPLHWSSLVPFPPNVDTDSLDE